MSHWRLRVQYIWFYSALASQLGKMCNSLPLLVHPRCLSISESRDPCKWNDHEQIRGCLARNGFPAVIWCWNASLADKYQSFQNPQTSSKSQTSIFLQINTPTPWLANCLASLSATNASDTDRQPRATQKRTHSCPTVQRSEIRLRWLRLWLKLLSAKVSKSVKLLSALHCLRNACDMRCVCYIDAKCHKLVTYGHVISLPSKVDPFIRFMKFIFHQGYQPPIPTAPHGATRHAPGIACNAPA